MGTSQIETNLNGSGECYVATNRTNQNPSFYLYCEFVLVESKKWNLELYNIHSSNKG